MTRVLRRKYHTLLWAVQLRSLIHRPQSAPGNEGRADAYLGSDCVELSLRKLRGHGLIKYTNSVWVVTPQGKKLL